MKIWSAFVQHKVICFFFLSRSPGNFKANLKSLTIHIQGNKFSIILRSQVFFIRHQVARAHTKNSRSQVRFYHVGTTISCFDLMKETIYLLNLHNGLTKMYKSFFFINYIKWNLYCLTHNNKQSHVLHITWSSHHMTFCHNKCLYHFHSFVPLLPLILQ